MHRRFSYAIVASLGIFCGQAAYAEPTEFDFKDPKGVNCIAYSLDSMLEPFAGTAAGITGKVKFDPAKPEATSGAIAIETKSLRLDNKGMQDTLYGPDWLDAKNNPKIEFSVKKVTDAKKSGDNVFEMTVVGEMTIKGVTKELTVPVKLSYLPGKMSERGGNAKGDLLVLRSHFTVKRKDFGIKPDMGNTVVAEDIEIRVSIAGFAKK